MWFEREAIMKIAVTTLISVLSYFFLLGSFCVSSPAQEQEELVLFDFSIEELASLKVMSVTRSGDQELFSSSSAIYAITRDDIRSTGLTSLPEQFRMVPGIHVARIDGNKWAIASRGFNNRFNSRMLVQLDGRTLYSPIDSGVYWEYQDPMLEDLARIEVIRGPGGSLWGANAFHGIINILSKPACETLGWLVNGGAGTEERGFGAVRYGSQVSDNAFFRIYAKHTERDDTATYGTVHTDDISSSQGGFRIDWGDVLDSSFTLQGDLFYSRRGDSYRSIDLAGGTNSATTIDLEAVGGNVLGRWSRSFSERSSMQLQVYYDRNEFKGEKDLFGPTKVDVFDIDSQHNCAIGERQQAVWGLGYRLVYSHFQNSSRLTFDPRKRTTQTFSLFLQDSIALIHDRLALIAGTKVEKNDHTGWEIQPNVRLAWTPDEKHTLWVAVSRAVRVPSITDEDLDLIVTMLAPNTALTIEGNRNIKSEKVVALESGLRLYLIEKVFFDIAAFSNWYNDIRSTSTKVPWPPVIEYTNQQKGYSHGIEASATFHIYPQWKLSAGYAWMNMHLDGAEAGKEDDTKLTPAHQFQVRSYYNFTTDLELNTALYYYDRISYHDTDSFFRLDLGLIWKSVSNFELGVWGQNLLESKHKEYGADPFFSAGAGEIQRSFYAKITWRF